MSIRFVLVEIVLEETVLVGDPLYYFTRFNLKDMGLDFTNFSSEIKRTWLFDTIIR